MCAITDDNNMVNDIKLCKGRVLLRLITHTATWHTPCHLHVLTLDMSLAIKRIEGNF